MVNSNYKASCQCPKCPPETKHVCGNDGKTYVNECELRKQSCTTKTNIGVLHPGKCGKFLIICLAVSFFAVLINFYSPLKSLISFYPFFCFVVFWIPSFSLPIVSVLSFPKFKTFASSITSAFTYIIFN